MVERYIRWVLGHRIAVLVFCGIVSALSLTVVKDGVFASSLVKLFLGDSPDYRRFQQLSEEFGSGDLIFVAIQDSVTFTPDGWEATRASGRTHCRDGCIRRGFYNRRR